MLCGCMVVAASVERLNIATSPLVLPLILLRLVLLYPVPMRLVLLPSPLSSLIRLPQLLLPLVLSP